MKEGSKITTCAAIRLCWALALSPACGLLLDCGAPRPAPWVPPEAEARVYDEDEVELPPRLIRMPSPAYPLELRRRQVPGRVELEYVIGADGRVEPGSIRVVATTHGEFARAAIEAVKEALYDPGVYSGARVRVRTRHVMEFRMRAVGGGR